MELSSEELARRKAVIRKALEKMREGISKIEEDAATYDADPIEAQVAYSDHEIQRMLGALFAATAGIVVVAGKDLGLEPKALATLAIQSMLTSRLLRDSEVSPQMRRH